MQADSSSNKVTVVGAVDPAAIKEKLEKKTKKKVDLISPQPKKDDNKEEKKEKKADKEKNPDSNNKQEKKPKEVMFPFPILKFKFPFQQPNICVLHVGFDVLSNQHLSVKNLLLTFLLFKL